MDPQLANLIDNCSTLIWDFDGVIADTEPVQARAFELLLRRRGFDVPDEFFRELIGSSEPDVWCALKDRFRFNDDIPSLIAERSPIYLEHARTLSVAPYVRPMLARAMANSATCVIASSGRYAHIGALLEHFQLLTFFREVYCNEGSNGPELPTKLARLAYAVEKWNGPFALIEDNAHYLASGASMGMATIAVQHYLNDVATGPWDIILDNRSARPTGQ